MNVNANFRLEDIDENTLYHEMLSYLRPVYYPQQFSADYLYEQACIIFSSICQAVSSRYGFDEERYIAKHDAYSPFDAVRDDFIEETISRMRKDIFIMQTMGIRAALVSLVHHAVSDNGGCISIMSGDAVAGSGGITTDEMYGVVPYVVVHSHSAATSDGYEVVRLSCLKIDSVGRLVCMVTGKDSAEYDVMPFRLVLDSLISVVCWLRDNAFLPEQDLPEWVCSDCGSSDVQTLGWVRPNENNDIVDYLGVEYNENNWCDQCENHVNLTRYSKYSSDKSSAEG